ncbi:ATP-binding protein [Leeuwenhoekiella marinoflava]|uniref:histidine kinase n=2 Tax=Leeuwenhoekiella marinoflava TaxID=988 RepID=A0A4Q0PIK2_9FLAO|nr:ATP-binding protein [Leeuwenhoekiella marinoflava]RXG26887.1 signal transduction histidine kinase [Leeuwenhoekiella marinoflava]SHF40233.1 Signal transduction histidine kinase [Leeuwenhoekiella marinoflava DSM 3653]
MAKRNKKYIPRKGNNPAILNRRIEKLEEELGRHGKNIDAISKSHAIHITMLSNFARHDIKNSIQSIDSIVSTNSSEEITDDHLNTIKLNLKIMRETIDNFSKLVPHSDEDKFSYNNLITAVELLNRDNFYENKISLIKEIEVNEEIYFNLPFQSVIQMINNIIINATKALTKVEKKRKIKFTVSRDNSFFKLKIFDNGEEVEKKIEHKIFEYGVSNTGGSGIGLHHAEYLCELYDGKITYHSLDDEEFTKYFCISLPLMKIE